MLAAIPNSMLNAERRVGAVLKPNPIFSVLFWRTINLLVLIFRADQSANQVPNIVGCLAISDNAIRK